MLKSAPHRFGSTRVKLPAATAGQRIGVMGGSFNPPHDGHASIARTALKRLKLDRLWWVVTPGNPLKDGGELASLDERMAASRTFATDRAMTVTGFEAQLGTTYTAATLSFLTARYPAVRFVWVMGADNLAGFHRWQHWQDIARMVPIAVVDRPGWRLKALASPAARLLERYRIPEHRAPALLDAPLPAWIFLTTSLSPLSSTEIRTRAAHNGRSS
jgi:nicotinate-nucleotide adenylyltransferase